MHILIDEAGVFAAPKNRANYVSCVAALIVPDSQIQSLESSFLRLKRRWGAPCQEVKGSSLSEPQFDSFFELLNRYQVVVEVSVIDRAIVSDEQVKHHQTGQAERVTSGLDDSCHPNYVRQVWDLRRRLENLSIPLYCQLLAMTDLAERSLQSGSLYYVQRCPKELSKFHWVLDSKSAGGGEFENLWSTIALPMLQSRSGSRPVLMLEGANYKYFSRFMSEFIPLHLQSILGQPDVNEGGINLKLIFGEHMRFADSATDLGIQMADLVATGFRRALSGTLQTKGYKKLGALFIRRTEKAIRLLSLDVERGEAPQSKLPYAHVVQSLEVDHKPMFLKSNDRRDESYG